MSAGTERREGVDVPCADCLDPRGCAEDVCANTDWRESSVGPDRQTALSAAERRWLQTMAPELEARFDRLAGRLDQVEAALEGLPDPMHPAIPAYMRDGLVNATIVLNHVVGHDDPGDVDAALAALREGRDTSQEQGLRAACSRVETQASIDFVKDVRGGGTAACSGGES